MNQSGSSRRLLQSNNSQQQLSTNSNFALNDRPPILEPEDGNGRRIVEESGAFLDNATIHHEQPAYSMMGGESDDQNPYLLGDEYYVDHGVLYQKAATTNLPSSHSQHQQSSSMGKINSHSRMATIGGTMHQIQQQEEQTIISLAPNYSQQQNAPSEMDMLASEGSGGIEATTNICCGLCGAIVLYEQFVPDHLPTFHPEVLVDGVIDLEEIPYETWLNEQHAKGDEKIGGSKMFNRRPSVGAGRRQHRHQPLFIPPPVNNRHHQTSQLFGQLRSTRQLRRISQYRVNTAEMSIPELEMALQKKMVEKMGRKVPVSLMDKLHAKCGLCDTVISLNKKFEIVHLVRHFNAWHPTAHKCAGTWPNKELPTPGSTGKPLSAQDFAVIDPDPEAADNLQCIWCGMFMSNRAIGMHFHEIHPEEVEVPKCNLCMQELLINARFAERFSEDFWVTLPDEHTFRSIRFKRDFKSEAALERAIVKYLKRIHEGADPNLVDVEDLDEPDEVEEEGEESAPGQQLLSCRAFQNSAMVCGKRAKPKRQFIMPIVRQAAPVDSKFVTAITHSHWKCKLCGADIFAAVISAGVIKHFKKAHPNELPRVQLELCQARLDKVSDGNMEMEMLTEQNLLDGVCNIKCKLCHHTLPMTPPFNICRAIRHIKIKHPEVMPEHKGGESSRGTFPSAAELAEMDEMAALKNRIMGDQELLDFAAQQPSTSAAADIADVKDGGHELEPGVIYATELLDYSVMEMLRNNYNVNFDRVFTIYGSEIDQKIFILTMTGEELDAQTVEEIVKVRDPNQNPMVVVLNQLGALVDADSITQ